jgi:hypothetical protein
MSFVNFSLAGQNTTGYVLALTGAGTFNAAAKTKCGSVTISVNGSGGDFWVCPIGVADGASPPAVIAADPRPAAGSQTYLRQIKSGESFTFGTPNSKGYDPAVHGSQPTTLPDFNGNGTVGFFSHVIVWCQAAGTVTTTQLQIEGS